MTYEVRTKEIAPQQIVAVRTRTRLAALGEEAGRAFGELFAHAGRAGAAPAGPPFGVYHGPPGDDGSPRPPRARYCLTSTSWKGPA